MQERNGESFVIQRGYETPGPTSNQLARVTNVLGRTTLFTRSPPIDELMPRRFAEASASPETTALHQKAVIGQSPIALRACRVQRRNWNHERKIDTYQ